MDKAAEAVKVVKKPQDVATGLSQQNANMPESPRMRTPPGRTENDKVFFQGEPERACSVEALRGLAQALDYVRQNKPAAAGIDEHVSFTDKKVKAAVKALQEQYKTPVALLDLDEGTSCKHLAGFCKLNRPQAEAVHNALTSLATCFKDFKNFRLLFNLGSFIVAKASGSLEDLCEHLRTFRLSNDAGLRSLCEELDSLSGENGPLGKYPSLLKLVRTICELSSNPLPHQREDDRARLREVMSLLGGSMPRYTSEGRNEGNNSSEKQGRPRSKSQTNMLVSPGAIDKVGKRDSARFKSPVNADTGRTVDQAEASVGPGAGNNATPNQNSSTEGGSTASSQKPSREKAVGTKKSRLPNSPARTPVDGGSKLKRKSAKVLASLPVATNLFPAKQGEGESNSGAPPSSPGPLESSTSNNPATSSGLVNRADSKSKATESESSSTSSRTTNSTSGIDSRSRSERVYAQSISRAFNEDEFLAVYEYDHLLALKKVLQSMDTDTRLSRDSYRRAVEKIEKQDRDALKRLCEVEKGAQHLSPAVGIFLSKIGSAVAELESEEQAKVGDEVGKPASKD